MILLADIGATNARICITEDCIKCLFSESLKVTNFNSLSVRRLKNKFECAD